MNFSQQQCPGSCYFKFMIVTSFPGTPIYVLFGFVYLFGFG